MANPPTDRYEKERHPLRSDESLAASILISKHRDHLNWVLKLPNWKALVDRAMEDLEIPSSRQGVSRDTAILALAIESKHQLVKAILKRASNQLPTPLVIKLASLWGTNIGNRFQLENRLNSNQWESLRGKLLLRISIEHRKYKSAQNLLYQSYNALAKRIANKICLESSKRDDCQQEALLGLIKAIDHIETEEAFTSYAMQWIERSVRNYLIKNKLPISAPLNAISKALKDNHNDHPETSNLSILFNALEQTRLPFELFEAEPKPSEASAIPTEETPDFLAARSDTAHMIRNALLRLSAKQREVIRLKFGIHTDALSDQEIGEHTGITRQQVGRREKRALAKLFEILQPLSHELA